MRINGTGLLKFSTYMFFVMTYIENTIPYGQILTFISLALMILACARSRSGRLPLSFKSGYLDYIILFFVFSIASMFWAESSARSFIIVRGMLMILIQMTVVYCCHFENAPVDLFLRVIMNGGYIVIFYATLRYGWSTIMAVFSEDIRISNEYFNANTLGMCAAYSIVINFYYMIYERFRFHDLLIVPALVMIAASGSRKSIVIAAVGILALVVMKNLDNKRFAKNLLKMIVALAAITGLIIVLWQLPLFELLRNRMSGIWTVINGTAVRGTSGYIRMVYNRIGWDLFKQHPWLGIGLHNANRYIAQYYGHPHLHNNFIELLACGGIVGFAIHYSFYFYLFISFWKLRKQRTKEYDICLVVLLIRFVMGYGYIQYYQLSTYLNLMVFYFLIKKLKNSKDTGVEGIVKS